MSINVNSIGKQIYEMLLDFGKTCNRGLDRRYRERFDLVLTQTVFFAEFDHLFQVLCENAASLPFSVSWFNFTEKEIELFEKFSNSPVCHRAKRRLLQLKQIDTFMPRYYFHSPIDFVQIDNLDAPICILSCSINETIHISQQSGEANIYQFFDGYEKECADEEELKLVAQLLEAKKTALDIDPQATRLRFSNYVERNISPGTRVLDGDEVMVIGQDTLIPIEGGESNIYPLKADKTKVIKLFLYANPNKEKKIHFLLNETTKRRLLAEFCALPSSIVRSESGEILGYSMDYIEGERLDRYCKSLFDLKGTTSIEVIELFLKIALAVHAVHLSDFIIGDLSYANFLVTPEGDVKIVDCDSFQMLNYPCEGRRVEAQFLSRDFHTIAFDYGSLRDMYKRLIELCSEDILKDTIKSDYYTILKTYKSQIQDVSGFIYAFYYFLHSKGAI